MVKALLCAVLSLCVGAFAEGPSLSLKSTSGNIIRTTDYRGRVVVLNFWATWCTPCAIEMKNFVKLNDRYREKPVSVLAASLDDQRTKRYVPPFVQSRKMSFPVLVDATEEDVKRFGGKGTLPFTVVLARDGSVATRFDHPVKEDELAAAVDSALQK